MKTIIKKVELNEEVKNLLDERINTYQYLQIGEVESKSHFYDSYFHAYVFSDLERVMGLDQEFFDLPVNVQKFFAIATNYQFCKKYYSDLYDPNNIFEKYTYYNRKVEEYSFALCSFDEEEACKIVRYLLKESSLNNLEKKAIKRVFMLRMEDKIR